MSNNYYEVIIDKIRDLISKEDYSEADALIKEELSMPYVPRDVLEELEKLSSEIRGNLIDEKPETLLKPEQIMEYLLGDSESAFAALDTLKRGNIRNCLEPVQEYLLIEEGDDLMKALLLELCSLQQVTVPLKVLKNGRLNEYIPAELDSVMANPETLEIIQILRQYLENENPSFLEQCLQVLVQHAYDIYPESYPENSQNTACSIIKYVFTAYDEPEEFSEFCVEHGIDEKAVADLDCLCCKES